MQIKYNPQTLGQLSGQPAGGESMDDTSFCVCFGFVCVWGFLKKKKKNPYFSRKKVLTANKKT